MNTRYSLQMVLKSDAVFGRGDGVPGVTDIEVQHDEWGRPYLGGRSLKGLMVAECAEIIAALPKDHKPRWEASARRLFGIPGSSQESSAIMSVGNAELPSDLRSAIKQAVLASRISPDEILESLTALRRLTAIADTGIPLEHTLRTVRVVLRETQFQADLVFCERPSDDDLALLAACVKALRRVGTGRNRGLGRVKTELFDDSGNSVTERFFEVFRKEVL